METFLQIFFVLLVIVLLILFVFQPRRKAAFVLPEGYQELLQDYVRFYANLDEGGKRIFEDRMQKFLSAVKISAGRAQLEDLDIILIGAAAIIPVYYIPDWEYVNLREIIVYPGNFNTDFEQQGAERMISGMVGTGAMENVMIISKWDLRQGFINGNSNRNTAIHEFIHLIDKMDGTLDGVPEILLERKYLAKWQQLLQLTMENIRQGLSDIDPYAATSAIECFAVVSEYYFEQPQSFQAQHPEWASLLQMVFSKKKKA